MSIIGGHTCIGDDGGTPGRRCEACEIESQGKGIMQHQIDGVDVVTQDMASWSKTTMHLRSVTTERDQLALAIRPKGGLADNWSVCDLVNLASAHRADSETMDAVSATDDYGDTTDPDKARLLREQRTTTEVCICAAIVTKDGTVVRGHRHADAMRTAFDAKHRPSRDPDAQGFITSRNRYVGRREALALQQAAGIKSADVARNPDGAYRADELYSEDLY
jgi:hypothetical protein